MQILNVSQWEEAREGGRLLTLLSLSTPFGHQDLHTKKKKNRERSIDKKNMQKRAYDHHSQ
jgi:hypothetical protein